MDNYDDNVYDICQMKDGKLWVTTDIGGVRMISPEKMTDSGNLFFDETTVLLSSLNSRSIAEDEYGNIWVGNHSTGVDFISVGKQDFNLLDYHDLDGSTPSVYSIVDDSEKGFWMASDSELVWWQDGGIKGRWSILNRLRRQYVFPRCMMADRQGNIWIGIDDQGVYRFNKKTSQFSHILITPEGSDIHSFFEDAKGRIWIGGEFGVYLYENGKATLQEFVSKTIHAPATCIMETAPHQLFIATLGDGIYSVNLQSHTSHHISQLEGLPSNKVNSTIRDGHNGLWLATDKGLVYIADPIGLTGMSVYGREQGLSDSHIRALQQDADGKIWLSTYTGISCLRV